MKKIALFIIIVVLILGLSSFYLKEYLSIEYWASGVGEWRRTIDENFKLASVAFLLAHFLIAALPIPWVSTLSMIGGLLFGAKYSILYSVLMTAVGGGVSFLWMKYFLHDYVKEKYGHYYKKYLSNEKNNIKVLISLRIFPIIPFFMVNAISSLSSIRLIDFIWASVVGRLPIIVLYSYIGGEVHNVSHVKDLISTKILFLFAVMAIFPWALDFMMKKMKAINFLLFLTILLSLRSNHIFAQSTLYDYTISAVVADKVVQIQNIAKSQDVNVNDVFAIFSHESHDVLGYAEVSKVNPESEFFEALVETHHQSGMIRSGNYLVKLNLSTVKNSVPARIELLSYSKRKVAAKYRHMVYTGFFLGQTAQPLLKKEFIVGPSFFAYGYRDSLQFHTSVLNTFFGTPNIGYKFLFGRSADFALAFSQEFNYYPDARRTYHEFSFHLDTYSNSKFLSYSKLKFSTKRPETKTLTSNDEYMSDLSTELQLAYGYMTDTWNRFIFGPKVDFEKKVVGGSVGYYYIDKEFHMLIGASANDFSEAKLGKDGYILNLDFWWRF